MLIEDVPAQFFFKSALKLKSRRHSRIFCRFVVLPVVVFVTIYDIAPPVRMV